MQVYVDESPANGVGLARAAVKGSTLSIRVHMGDPFIFNEGMAVWFLPAVSPSGWAKDFLGVCKVSAGDRNWEVTGTAEWERHPNGKWGIRCVFDRTDMGDRLFLSKRYPWTTRTGDAWQVTISLP